MKHVPQITNARPSRADELRYRERRYVFMMGLRAVCLVAATIIVTARVPLGWLWATVLVLGSLILPWAAVILANDRSPKNSRRYSPAAMAEPIQRELTSPIVVVEPRTIDHEP